MILSRSVRLDIWTMFPLTAADVRSGGIMRVASTGFDHHLLGRSAAPRVKE